MITKIRNISEGLDNNGNVVSKVITEFPQNQETTHDISIQNDGLNLTVELTSGLGGRPKNRPSPSAK